MFIYGVVRCPGLCGVGGGKVTYAKVNVIEGRVKGREERVLKIQLK